MKSLLESKKSLENNKRLGIGILPERDAAANYSSAAPCSQTRVRLESSGITFPDRRNTTSSTSFWLSPNTPEEEEEQLCVAKQLSLGCTPIGNGQYFAVLQVFKEMNETLIFCSILPSLCALFHRYSFTVIVRWMRVSF